MKFLTTWFFAFTTKWHWYAMLACMYTTIPLKATLSLFKAIRFFTLLHSLPPKKFHAGYRVLYNNHHICFDDIFGNQVLCIDDKAAWLLHVELHALHNNPDNQMHVP